MLPALKSLLESRRSLVTLITALFETAILFGLWLPAASEGEAGEPVQLLAEKVATIVGILGGFLVACFTATDVGKALTLPVGVGHRDVVPQLQVLLPADEPANRGFALVDAMLGLAGIALIALACAVVVMR